MKTRNIAGFFLFATVIIVTPLLSTAQSSILYDDFNQGLLDPLRWIAGGACYSSNYQEMECVRAIQGGSLLMAHRNFGQRDSDVGNQFGQASLNFANPASIKKITTDVVVRAIAEVPCAANPQAGGQVQINGTFFNSGSGNASDDVGASLAFTHAVTDPKGEVFVWAQIFQGSTYFGFVPIGNVSFGDTVTTTLTWDKANHQFIAAATDHVNNVKMQITLPYSFSDGASAINPSRNFGVVNFPGNCTKNATWGYTEATFDNVRVAQ